MNEQIRALESQIQEARRKLADLRRTQFAQVPTEDFSFRGSEGNIVRLSELFEDKDDLIVIHNMGQRCSYCTMWADGINGLRVHLENRAALALCSPDDPETMREFARGRGWGFRLISAQGNQFNEAMGFAEAGKPGVWPGVSAFSRGKGGAIVRTGAATFGPGDEFCALWPLLALLKDGAAGWEPKFSY